MGIVEIIGYVGYIAGAIVILTSKTKTDNLNDLKMRVEILEKERDYHKAELTTNIQAISKLEGQLQIYKEVPLTAIDESLRELSISNRAILQTLKTSALIVARDRDNPQDQHITEQTVDKQIINNKG